LQDAVRIATRDLDETISRLVQHVIAPKPPWTYNPVRAVAPPLLARELPLSAAMHACGRRGPQVARDMNMEVGRIVWEAGAGRKLRCFPLSARHFAIRHDIQLRIPADFYLVEERRPVVFWLQPRKGYLLDDFGRRLLASVVRQEMAPEWDEFDFEMLDASPLAPGEARCARMFRGADLPLLSDKEVAEVMQRFADALDVVRAMDLDDKKGTDDRPDGPDPIGLLFGGR
jgi:hypothetical protein